MRTIFIYILFAYNLIFAQSVSITPASLVSNRNTEITIEVSATDMENLAAYSVQLSYNKTILFCKSINKMNFLSQNASTFFFSSVDSNLGKIQIDEAILGQSTVSGNGTLAKIIFVPKDTGSTELIFANKDFRSFNNTQMIVNAVGGIIKIQNNLIVKDEIKKDFVVMNNYPNPFNPSTTFEINLDKAQEVSLDIFNITGELVQSILKNAWLEKGKNKIFYYALNLQSGVYFYRLSNERFSTINKMILLK